MVQSDVVWHQRVMSDQRLLFAIKEDVKFRIVNILPQKTKHVDTDWLNTLV